MAKTAQEKLNHSGDLPKVVALEDPAQQARLGGRTMLVAPPVEYDQLMKQVPHGHLATLDRLRAYLAQRHGADVTCPLTAGIFARLVAEAADERSGADPTPWWRTLKRDGELNPKYPGGVERQAALLQAEGHKVTQRGKRWFVADYQAQLWTP
ncbi:MAG: MGMT family protein [Micrococcales bacterium]|nr:MGMT family protein [Micrococcales bacterium]